MSKTRLVSSVACLMVCALAWTANAEDKKPAPPAAPVAAKPAPVPVVAAPMVANKPGATPPAAAAAAPAGPPMPTPSKELEAFMKGFEGSWKCDTKFAAGAMGPGSPEMMTKSTVKIAKQYGGFAWHGEYSVPKSKMLPAMTGIFQIAYDSGTNQPTIVSYDNMGNATLGTGPISGDTATFVEEAYMMGMKSKVRETMTKKSPKEIAHKYEVDLGKGFMLMGDDACKK